MLENCPLVTARLIPAETTIRRHPSEGGSRHNFFRRYASATSETGFLSPAAATRRSKISIEQ